ncbi:MAG: hypothetical protein ACYCSQ_00270 [bacterium]
MYSVVLVSGKKETVLISLRYLNWAEKFKRDNAFKYADKGYLKIYDFNFAINI